MRYFCTPIVTVGIFNDALLCSVVVGLCVGDGMCVGIGVVVGAICFVLVQPLSSTTTAKIIVIPINIRFI